MKESSSRKNKFGLIYKNVFFYRMMMRALYRKSYFDKYAFVIQEIPVGSTVVDLCCSDSAIAPAVAERGCKYVGLDINEKFIKFGRSKGYDVRLWDADTMDFPEADVICIQSSLYQFIPNDLQLLERMLARARKKIIIAEPVENFASSKSSIIRRLAHRLTEVNGKAFRYRHTEESLDALIKKLPEKNIRRVRCGREIIISVSKEKKA